MFLWQSTQCKSVGHSSRGRPGGRKKSQKGAVRMSEDNQERERSWKPREEMDPRGAETQ